MNTAVDHHREQIAALCRQFDVRRLDLFGSVLTPDFDLAQSDVDVVAEFGAAPLGEGVDRYIGFKTAMERLLSRPVDVVELNALRNQRLKRHIESSRVPFYAAA